METARFEIGRLLTREFRIALSEWNLPYDEHKGVFECVFIVKARTAEERTRLVAFGPEIRAWVERMEARKRQWGRQQAAMENARKLRSINRRRRLTFRKPLDRLPAGV